LAYEYEGDGCAKMIDGNGEGQVFESMRDGSNMVNVGQKAWTKGPETEERTMCGSHWAHEEQEYMGDGDQ
jgi:hypothetical protein